MERQGKRSLRLVLVPCPFQGHMNPMLQLGTILNSKGFSITIAHTQFNSPKPSSHPDFSFLPLPDTLPDHNSSTSDLVTFVWDLNANYIDCFQKCLAEVMGQQGPDDRIVCIIYDEVMCFSEAAAKDLKLPSIVFRTSSAATFLARTGLIQLKAQGYIPFPASMSQDLIPELYPLRFKDLPLSVFVTLENHIQHLITYTNIRTSSAIIWNTIDFLEKSSLAKIQHQSQVPIFSIGPLHEIASASSSSLLEEDTITSCLTWLNKQSHNSVIYVSFGSVAFMEIKELVEIAWGLANSQQPFLWVVRPGSVNGSEWIEVLPEGFKEIIGERGYIVKWAPQKKVLAHGAVGGFLSHCGWNSTLESICGGIPMICRPCFSDQRVIARYISQVWKVGLELENELERGGIEISIRRLMVDKEGKEMREMAKILKEGVELCIREGGSSNNSLNGLIEMIMSF